VKEIVPVITEGVRVKGGNGNENGDGEDGRDDGNYGSSATRDVEVLQALSRRIHFGKSPRSLASSFYSFLFLRVWASTCTCT
jgi:hypothetical protein